MADKEIGSLTAADALDGTELIHAVQSSNSRKATAAQIQDFVLTGVDQDITPDADGTRDLGASGNAWAQVWADEYGDSDGGSVSSVYVTNGPSKSWVNLNGSGTVAVRDSLNVSSITDNGTGNYSVNLSNAMATANYAFCMGGKYDTTNSDNNVPIVNHYRTTQSASLIRAQSSTGGGAFDCDTVCVSAIGDLAWHIYGCGCRKRNKP